MGPRRLATSLFLASLLVLGVVACGGGDATRPAAQEAPTPRPALRTTVYFLTDKGAAPLGVRRTIARRSPHARQALEALFAGPTAGERKRGITTAIPTQARLLSLILKERDRAVINVSGLPPAKGRQGAEATLGQRVRVITQIARTLIGVSGIERVEIRADSNPWDLWTMDGRIVRAQTDYDRLRGWRICGGRSAEERRLNVSRCFSALP